MKNKILILLLATVFVACKKEKALVASNADEDRVASQIDTSNTLVNNWYKNYNMGVLFEYNDTTDFAYVASSITAEHIWNGVEIPKIRTLFQDSTGTVPAAKQAAFKAYKNQVVNFLNNSLFKFFKPNSQIATWMPYKVLVSESIYSPVTVAGEGAQVVVESDSRLSNAAIYSMRTIYNSNSIVFGIDLNNIGTDTVRYSKDNFYILFSRIMGMHHLYDLVPDEFYGSKSNYYGKGLDSVYRQENGIASTATVYVIDKNWFYSKGFIDAKYFYGTSYGLSTYTQYYDTNGVRLTTPIVYQKALLPTYTFVASKDKDVRSYLNEMIHRNATEIQAFPQNIRNNMKILLNLFNSWGVDMLAVNPDLYVLN